MPVLVSGASFACNFVRGSYLEVRVTTSQPVTGQRPPRSPLLYILSYKRGQASFNGFGLNHAGHEKKTFLPSRGHPIFDRVKNDFISAEWMG